MAEPDSPLVVGQVLDGKYEVRGTLGGGAMGLVFEAHHVLLDKKVAIKVLRPELSSNEDLRSRFEAEARAAAAIGHPNIVSVTDMGRTEQGAIYFVMDRLAGETLGDRLARRGRLDPPTACAIAIEMLGGLEAAHALGLVHRDLKPENVFLAVSPGGRETAKILDFGVAKALAATGRRASGTQVGMALGTPEYMAPEQARGVSDLDARVDLYAVGIILYRMLAGRNPYGGENTVSVLTAVLTEQATPLAELCPEAPPALVRLVESAMSRERESRPRSASDFRAQLLALAPGPVLSPSMAGASPVGTGVPATQPVTQPFAGPPGVSGPVYSMTELGARIDEPTHLPTRRVALSLTESDYEPPAPVAAPPKLVDSDDALELARPVRRAAPPPERRGVDWRGLWRTTATGVRVVVILAALGAAMVLVWPRGRHLLPGDGSRFFKPLPKDDAVLVEIDVAPRESRVFLDGNPLPSNPLRLPRTAHLHKVMALADGYQPGAVEFRADRAHTVFLRLKPLPPPSSRSPRKDR